MREYVARGSAVLDVILLHCQTHLSGPKIVLGESIQDRCSASPSFDGEIYQQMGNNPRIKDYKGYRLSMKLNSQNNTSPAFAAMSWLALVGGVVIYIIGLWRSDMQLNEKGYYFAVILLALFSSVSLQKTVRDRIENIPTSHIYYISCIASFFIAVILLAVGLWNATLLPSEKGFYAIAFFLSLFGAISVQKNVRDSQTTMEDHVLTKKTDVYETEEN